MRDHIDRTREIASAAVASAVVADLAQAVAWHRQVAALAAAAHRAGVATTELPAVRSRLLGQQSRLAEAAARTGAALPALMPTASEIAMATPALGDLTDAVVEHTVRTMMSTLDAIDAALGSPPPATSTSPDTRPANGPSTNAPSTHHASTNPPSTSVVPGDAPLGSTPPGSVGTPFTAAPPPGASTHAPAQAAPAVGPAGPPASHAGVPSAAVAATGGRVALRNGLVYAGFALSVLAMQIFLFVVLDEATSLPLFAPLCLLVLPAFAWLAGYLTVGIAFRSPPGAPSPKRNPRLGAVICLLPDLLLCAWVGVLFVANRF